MNRFEKYLSVLVLGGLIFSTSVIFANGQQEAPEVADSLEELEESEALNEAEELLDEDIDTDEQMQLVETEGMLITGVIEDSAASRAGLIRGDIILSVNGEEVESINELTDAISELSHGDEITLNVSRGGEVLSLPLTLEMRIGWPLIGIYGSGPQEGRAQGGNRNNMDWDELFEQFDNEGFNYQMVPGGRGMGSMFSEDLPEEVLTAIESGSAALVSEVSTESPAEAGGIIASAVIIAIDGESLVEGDLKSAVLAHNSGDTITLSIYQNEELSDIKVTLGDADGTPLLGVTYSALGSQMRGQYGDDDMTFGGQKGNRPKGLQRDVDPTDG